LSGVSHYPDGKCVKLRRRLAEYLHLDKDQIIVSNGASNILLLIAEAFLDRGDEAVMAVPSFPVYRKSTQMVGGIPVQVPLEDHTHNLEAMLAAVTERTKLVFICNPNNPTGTIVERDTLEAFLDRLPPGIAVVLDEVYIDFSTSTNLPDTLQYIRSDRPVISVRSFSKLYGLAGLRVGYALAAAPLISLLDKVRDAFPVNTPAQAGATVALDDPEYRDFVIARTREGLDSLYDYFDGRGLSYVPSHGNFLFVNLGIDNQEAFRKLMARGILIHPIALKGYEQWCRISVGTPDQTRKLIQALEILLSEP
jgi:histidinol-phosphate aminotransferase